MKFVVKRILQSGESKNMFLFCFIFLCENFKLIKIVESFRVLVFVIKYERMTIYVTTK